MKMMTIKTKVPSTPEEIASVNENNRPTMSEQLHKKRNNKTKRLAMYNSLSKDFELIGEEY